MPKQATLAVPQAGDRYWDNRHEIDVLVTWVGKKKARLTGENAVSKVTMTVWLDRFPGANFEYLGSEVDA